MRAELETVIGKHVLSLVMAGDVAALRKLVAEIERRLAREIVPDKMTSGFVLCSPRQSEPHEWEDLRRALMVIGSGRYTWKELEARLAAYHVAKRDRRVIRRTWQELQLRITIEPAPSGAPRKPRTRKRTR